MAIIRMTAKEAREYAKKNRAKLDAAYAKAKPVALKNTKAKPIARGFAAFKEYINRNGRPPVKDKKITIGIRLPESLVIKLRRKEKYSRDIANYVTEGFNSGLLKFSSSFKNK